MSLRVCFHTLVNPQQFYHTHMSNIKPTSTCPRLTELAQACMNGACNMSGIIIGLHEAIVDIDRSLIKDHPAIKVILGQLSFLCKESLGPTPEAIEAYDQWRVWSESPDKITFEQHMAIKQQAGRWEKMGEPVPVIGGDGAVAVDVGSMVLCIERDGHCHS